MSASSRRRAQSAVTTNDAAPRSRSRRRPSRCAGKIRPHPMIPRRSGLPAARSTVSMAPGPSPLDPSTRASYSMRPGPGLYPASGHQRLIQAREHHTRCDGSRPFHEAGTGFAIGPAVPGEGYSRWPLGRVAISPRPRHGSSAGWPSAHGSATAPQQGDDQSDGGGKHRQRGQPSQRVDPHAVDALSHHRAIVRHQHDQHEQRRRE